MNDTEKTGKKPREADRRLEAQYVDAKRRSHGTEGAPRLSDRRYVGSRSSSVGYRSESSADGARVMIDSWVEVKDGEMAVRREHSGVRAGLLEQSCANAEAKALRLRN